MAKKEENPLFVGITNKDELRKGMLECSKSILESLKFFESFKSVREEKSILIRQLKGDLRDISKSINLLRSSLPQVKDGEIKKPEAKKAEPKPKAEKKEPLKAEKPPEKAEIDRLEAELNEIEAKLNAIS